MPGNSENPKSNLKAFAIFEETWSFHCLPSLNSKSINSQSQLAPESHPRAKKQSTRPKSKEAWMMAKLLLTSLQFYCFPWEIIHNLCAIHKYDGEFRAVCVSSEDFLFLRLPNVKRYFFIIVHISLGFVISKRSKVQRLRHFAILQTADLY